MEMIKAVEANLGDTVVMVVTSPDCLPYMVAGKLVDRSFEDLDEWITLTLETPAGNVAHDFPFDDIVVRRV